MTPVDHQQKFRVSIHCRGKNSSFSQKSFQETFTELRKLRCFLTVTFAFFKLNRVAMCFVFINVALLMRDVDASCSQLTKKF